MYRSKLRYPGQIVMIGRLNSGAWFIEGIEGDFSSIEEIEKFLEDELELIVVKQ